MAPIFVGSNSDDTRIRSNRVGLAASTSDPGSASEGDIYYNSTGNQIKTYDGSSWSAIQGSGTVEVVASGTIPNGATVIINTDGTVGIVTLVPSNTPTFGSAVVFESALSNHVSATFDSTNNKVVVAYQDSPNSFNGTAIVGTVSGTSISFGTPVVFNSGTTSFISATFDSSNNKVVVAYRNESNSDYGTAIVGTVSGTSISFGTAVVFESANSKHVSAVYDSTNGKVVIAYRDDGNSAAGTAIVGTVSGTSISFGSETVFESASIFYTSATYDSDNGKVVIAYRDIGNSSYGTAVVGTVSGTSISFGSAVVFESANSSYQVAVYDSTNEKVVIGYTDYGNSEYGTAVVFSSNTLATNLTANNFIGFSDAAYSDGDTANIQIEGSVDDAQSGLTTARKHYVQTDGTLSTTAGDPSVPAGTAISGTKIIIET